MRVDAHQHFWRIERADYGWLTREAHPRLFRDFGPGDLQPLLAAAGIEQTVLVQAAPTEAETDFLLDIAERTPFVAGVVGWIDFEAAGAAATIERMSRRPMLLGLRPMIQDIADDAWMLSRRIAPALEAMTAAGLRFDALLKPRHLSLFLRFAERFPGLPVVIDHGAKPDIAAGEIQVWSSLMFEVAKETGAFCKLSGLITEAGAGWSSATLRPFVDTLVECFGPARLMWGSDWPVLNEAGDYASWCAAAKQLTAALPPSARKSIFGGTATAFYGLAS